MPEDFTDDRCFYQLGRPPFRADIMMSIPGVSFESAWVNRELVDIEGLSVPFISKADLIKSKRAAGRPQDLIDADNLERSGL